MGSIDDLYKNMILGFDPALQGVVGPKGATGPSGIKGPNGSDTLDFENNISRIDMYYSISDDDRFISFLEKVAEVTNKRKYTIVTIPSDYQLGMTLEYMMDNKSMSHIEDGIWRTPLETKVKFIIYN